MAFLRIDRWGNVILYWNLDRSVDCIGEKCKIMILNFCSPKVEHHLTEVCGPYILFSLVDVQEHSMKFKG